MANIPLSTTPPSSSEPKYDIFERTVEVNQRPLQQNLPQPGPPRSSWKPLNLQKTLKRFLRLEPSEDAFAAASAAAENQRSRPIALQPAAAQRLIVSQPIAPPQQQAAAARTLTISRQIPNPPPPRRRKLSPQSAVAAFKPAQFGSKYTQNANALNANAYANQNMYAVDQLHGRIGRNISPTFKRPGATAAAARSSSMSPSEKRSQSPQKNKLFKSVPVRANRIDQSGVINAVEV